MLDFSNLPRGKSDTQIFYCSNAFENISSITADRIPIVSTNYDTHGAQTRSGTISLTSGSLYVFAVRQQDATLGDTLQVTWKRPLQAAASLQLDELETRNINLKIFSTKNSSYATPAANAIALDNAINTNNANITLEYDGFVDANIALNWTSSNQLTASNVYIPNNGDYFSTQAIFKIIAKETGIYTFSTRSDDASDLFLLTSSTINLKNWQIWQKPRGAKMVHIVCIGAGGGGGSGRTTVNQNSGGGGGASGGITKLLIPAAILPDLLYINVGKGGIGVNPPALPRSGSSYGQSGEDSIVSLSPDFSINSLICAAPGGIGGIGGLFTGPSAGGASTNAYTQINSPFMALGLFKTEPTIAGVRASNDTGILSSTYALSSSVVTGGCGGASAVTNEAGMVFSSSVFLLSNVTASRNGSGIPGFNGYGLLSPIFCGTGGAGGSGNNNLTTINGQKGGDGFYGCGGGGGGPYITSTPAGRRGGAGGNGGDGLVIITTSF